VGRAYYKKNLVFFHKGEKVTSDKKQGDPYKGVLRTRVAMSHNGLGPHWVIIDKGHFRKAKK